MRLSRSGGGGGAGKVAFVPGFLHPGKYLHGTLMMFAGAGKPGQDEGRPGGAAYIQGGTARRGSSG